ncbi:MAG: class F sortase [Candidatus Roizmanbacteria bacterium]
MFFNHEETASEIAITLARRLGVIGFCVVFLLLLTRIMSFAQTQSDSAATSTPPFVIFGQTVKLSPTPTISPTPTLTPTLTPSPTPIMLPVYVSIPAIGIQNARVEYLSVTSDGVMETPQQSGDVGWLQIGPKPGENGASIFSGHYDDQMGQPAIFYNLKYAQIGSEIIIGMSDGSERRYVVNFIGEIDAYLNNVDAITRQTDVPSLTLVTCHGTWDVARHIYSKRLVVYASVK